MNSTAALTPPLVGHWSADEGHLIAEVGHYFFGKQIHGCGHILMRYHAAGIEPTNESVGIVHFLNLPSFSTTCPAVPTAAYSSQNGFVVQHLCPTRAASGTGAQGTQIIVYGSLEIPSGFPFILSDVHWDRYIHGPGCRVVAVLFQLLAVGLSPVNAPCTDTIVGATKTLCPTVPPIEGIGAVDAIYTGGCGC